ncbi:MAG TPA: carboxypeptidase-like regulatory domain-containing protein [Longimicrobium sp.]|nr:carboxypeptidase-like regulatory domain-containing protein [Longimicrobium sp.]
MHLKGMGRAIGGSRGMLCLLALLAWTAPGAAAQTVQGRLLDAETAAPIAGARMHLVEEDGDTAHSSSTDVEGVFVLYAHELGMYRVQASRLGYRDGTSEPIHLAADAIFNIELRMSSSAVQLAPLTVTGQARYARLEEQGFYERRDHFGPDGLREAVYLEQHDIERMRPGRVADIFRHVRGVRLTGGTPLMRGGCQPAIVINGWTAMRGGDQRGTGFSSRTVDPPRALVGVEVYYGRAIPERYLLDAGGCGVILYWTK